MTRITKYRGLVATSTLAVALASSPALAQDSVVSADESAANAIIVSGLRGQPRSVTDSAVPVDVFSEETIERASQTDTLDILQTLIPSYTVNRAANTTSDTFIRAPSLRGLPADKTLLLLNGRRRHKSASVGVSRYGSHAADSAVIPAIALKSIEVLRDGAAAQYGSDAIAGVINYELKDDNHGGSLVAQVGQYYEGDGESVQIAGNIGLPLTDNGFINISGQYTDNDYTNRARTFDSTSWNPFDAYENDPAYRDAVDAAGIDISEPMEVRGQPKERAGRIVVNSGIDLSDDTELYAFGNFSRSKGTAMATFRVPGGGHVVMDNPVRLEDGSTWRFADRFPLGYQPNFSGKVTDWSIAGGWRTERDLGGDQTFSADVAARYGWDKIEYSIADTVNPSMGPDSPTDFDASTYTSDEFALNADFVYTVGVGLAGPLVFNFGGEFRREGFKIGAGSPGSYTGGPWGMADPFNFCSNEADFADRSLNAGAPMGMGISCTDPSDPVYTIMQPGSNGITGLSPDVASDFTTESKSAYAELSADVTDEWFVDFAGRYEDYQSFGDKFVWKIATRYNVTDWAAVRGSLGTGFRAPTAGQLNMTQSAINTVGGVPMNIGLYPASHPVAQYLGGEELGPETSKNYSLGLTLNPFDGFTLTIDAYRIKIEDQLYATSRITVTDDIRAAMLEAGIEGAGAIDQIQFFQNAIDTTVEGLDIVASYRGYFLGDQPTTITAAFNTNSYNIDNVNIAQVSFNDVTVYNFENNNPDWRANATVFHDFGPVQAMVRANVFGPWSRQTTRAGNAIQDYGTEVLFDAELTAPLGDGYSLTLGARNLFDGYPPVNRIDDTNGRTYVDGPMSWQGGFYYARLNFDF
ncbi:TonB-dependent receptor plug domain-containing protein [Novosphingobium profundi]|uniref:TonB-dependent receptor plug domain-containing protein n=1 Tax=Novosphingobium profundi TaxID=1774954 RepID=UPI001CFF01AA|nr:TonB-dependent receptor [Novosphingobium profundi]